MKKLPPLLILIFAFSVFGQTSNLDPKAVYNKANKMVGIYDLTDCTGNGSKNFKGRIYRIQSHDEYDEYYFDIGKTTFDLDYGNLNNVARSNLSSFFRKGNLVAVYACAGGSNGVWHVINIKLLGK